MVRWVQWQRGRGVSLIYVPQVYSFSFKLEGICNHGNCYSLSLVMSLCLVLPAFVKKIFVMSLVLKSIVARVKWEDLQVILKIYRFWNIYFH